MAVQPLDGKTGKIEFDFGENWRHFLTEIDESRIAASEASRISLLGRARLDNLSFLDIGCGSGLFSLAAHRLGARVHSFDYSPGSVACAKALRDRYAAGSAQWIVERGSILDAAYVGRLGTFDIVYSWGVLHHTGAMWDAVGRAASLAKQGGTLAIALYHKTPACRFWATEKRFYASSPTWARRILDGCFAGVICSYLLLTWKNPVTYIRTYRRTRGMAFMTDIRDWLGGYPYESASPSEVLEFARTRRLAPQRYDLCSQRTGLLGTGCDQYVFRSAA